MDRGHPVGETAEPTDPRRAWQEAYGRSPLRDVPFETMSGVPVEPVYGDPPYPGQYPYTRGVYPSMYRSRLWTMRMFAGFGSADDTNRRFKELLRAGGTGLSTAFDMPTLLGADSDSPGARGEVGRAGVAVDTLVDVQDLFAGIDLSAVSTSMTVNGPAAILLAMYVAAAEASGVARRELGGTIQNDILKEYQAQKEYIFPPRPSVRLVTDTIAFTAAEMPRWHPVSISGYHIREAGSTAAQELAFTLANGFAYVEAATAAGLDVDAFAPRLSFFFNCHNDFFEEIGKLRAARRIWARWMRERYGARDERSLLCRFHTQTAGVSLTATQPEVNIARVAIQALAAALGGTQSLHTDAFDEALALPSDRAARIALRTQQVIAHETGVANVADPLGGSGYVEWMTDELERQAEEVFDHLLATGGGSVLEGVYEGIESGWFVGRIAEASYAYERDVNEGRRIVVGVNAFTEGNEDRVDDVLRIDPAVEEYQLQRLARVRSARDPGAVAAALRALGECAADPARNLMPPLIDAVRAHATEGEIVGALQAVFGGYVERIVV
ncbi:acyl-CoA mutase large subunit family protein [Miltoncostaea marina]|uniref:acyl-CoA mutase large subunit family protein n=1 Tax=Miltoncostaea marina TaxID=2843215 RepID=UPI001C3DC9AC|nr:methylmalonyl-CoA mutase family protein [Miltoncostaea marina]